MILNPPYQFTVDWFSHAKPIFNKWLKPLANQPCHLLEIGVHEGRSSIWLIDELLKHPDARLHCIDIQIQKAFLDNVELTGRKDKLTVHQGKSSFMLRSLPISFYDFIYIDGSHQACDVLEDAILAFPLLKPNGIMAFDDYLWKNSLANPLETPKPAIDAFLSVFAGKIAVLHRFYQVWVKKIIL